MYVSDTTVEHAINDKIGMALVKQRTSASEDVSSAGSRGQSSTSFPQSACDKAHSSVSEDLRESVQRHSRSSVAEDLPDTGRSRHTVTSLADELPNTGRSSKALSSVSENAKTVSKSESRSQSHSGPALDSRHSGKAEDIKSVSLSESVERSAAVRSQTAEHPDYSNDDESVAMEIDSEAKYVCDVLLYMTLAYFLSTAELQLFVLLLSQ